MAYIDVIPLADAKLYLRVDDTLSEDDTQITSMISVALKYVEDYTNILVYAREKTYRMIDGVVTVYDFPINSVTSPLIDTYNINEMTLYTTYCYGTDNTDLVLNVGYTLNTDVPLALIQVALEIIDILYYGKETGRTMADISEMSLNLLNQNKRFLL